MVVGAFPAAKLGALLLKQISKPIATVVKNQAKQRPFFRKYVCMPPAQFYNWCEVRAKMWMMNLGKPVNIPVLNEAMAIELGSNLLGEGIIFIIAAGIVLYEYNRSANKEEAKESAKRAEIQALNNAIRDLFLQTEEQGAHIRELTRKMGELGSFPVIKLGALLLRQISKPMAKAFIDEAKRSQFFRRYICIPPAQLYYKFEMHAKMWILSLGKPVNIPVLNESAAIELGANLLSEMVVFITASTILLYEMKRSSVKDEAKEQARRDEINNITSSIKELHDIVEEQNAQMKDLLNKFDSLETKWDNPIKGSKVPKRSPPPPPPAEPTISSEIDDPIYSPELSAEGKVTYAVESTVPESSGFILRTVKQIEHEFWASENKERSVSIVTDGLDHLQSIFRIHIN